jgi:D-inositol-3-phosphate glycosyltransferase
MKVLWVGDAVITSGFGVVTHSICNELASKCEIVVFGIGYNGKVRHQYSYYIYPGRDGNDIYSFSYLRDVVRIENPDVIVVFNDDHIVKNYLEVLKEVEKPIVVLLPVNYFPPTIKMLSPFIPMVNEILTYTEASNREVSQLIPTVPVTTVYHGVYPKVFYKIPNFKTGQLDLQTRKTVSGGFIVGNINTNTYRKRFDLFISAFADFARDKSDVFCLIHAPNKDAAYNLEDLITQYKILDKVILSTKSVEFSGLNVIYNVIDVNVNTSMGEGFGLTSLEGASCGNAIICPAHENLKDIWKSSAMYIDIARREPIANTPYIGDVISTTDLTSKLELLYSDRKLLEEMKESAFKRSQADQFKWTVVADKVYQALQRAVASRLMKIELK